MSQAGVLAGADGILDAGLDPVGGVDVGVLAQPALGGGGPVGGPQAIPPAVFGLEQGQLRAGMRPLTAGEDPHRRGPCLQLVPGRPLAQQPGQLGDVRFLDPARPVRARLAAAGVIGAPLADLAAAVDGDLPGLLRNQPQRRLLPLTQRPPDRVDQLVPGPGRELVQVLDQAVAGPGPIDRDHQPPPERRRQRRDRRGRQRDMVSGGVAARRAAAQHPGQRLPAGVITHRQQRMMTIAFEIRFGEFLVRMRERDGGIQPDAGHPVQRPVRQPHPRQPLLPRDDLRPRVPPRRIHRGRQPLIGPAPGAGDLLQRPPRRRHRRHQPEQLRLIGHHPEITDHPGAVRDRTRQIGQHPTPVMHQDPRAGQRPRQPARQARLIGQVPQQRQPGMRHHPLTAAGYFQAPRPAGNVHHVESAPRTQDSKDVRHPHCPSSGALFTSGALPSQQAR